MSLFQKQLPGSPFQVRAADWNAMKDAALAEKQRGRQGAGDAPSSARPVSTGKARNNEASTLEQYAAVALRDPIISADDNLVEFQKGPTFEAYEAESADVALAPQRIGVLLVPLGADAIGAVCLDGVVPCRVDMVNAAHQWARLTEGETYLTSGLVGEAEILWAEGGTGEQWALVRLGAAASGNHYCILDSQATSVTLPPSTSTLLEWNDPASQQSGAFWAAGQPSRMTLPAGVWRVGGYVSMTYPVPVENGQISGGFVGTEIGTVNAKLNACYAVAKLAKDGIESGNWRQLFICGVSSAFISIATISFDIPFFLVSSSYFQLTVVQSSLTVDATMGAKLWATKVG